MSNQDGIAERLRNYVSTAVLHLKNKGKLQEDLLAIAGDRHLFLAGVHLPGETKCYFCGKMEDDPIHTDSDVHVDGIGVMPRVMVKEKLRALTRVIERSLDTQCYSMPESQFNLMWAYYNALKGD